MVSGVAIGGALGSAGVSVFTAFSERADGKKAKACIETCQADHEKSVKRLTQETNKILQVVNQLVEKGIDFEVATVSTVAFLSNIGNSGLAGIRSVQAVASIEEALKIGQIQNILAPTGISITKKLSGGLSVTFPSIQAVEKMTEAQVKAFGSLAQGPEVLLGKTLTTMGKVVFVVQILFTVADVVLLIKSWNSEHPLVGPIDIFISSLQASVESTKNQLAALQIFR